MKRGLEERRDLPEQGGRGTAEEREEESERWQPLLDQGVRPSDERLWKRQKSKEEEGKTEKKDSEDAIDLLDQGGRGSEKVTDGERKKVRALPDQGVLEEKNVVQQEAPTAVLRCQEAPMQDHLLGGAVSLAKPSDSTSVRCLGNLEDDCAGVLSNNLWSDEGGKNGRELHKGLQGLTGSPMVSAYPLILSMLESLETRTRFKVHGKAKPTGDGFPLPSSMEALQGIGTLDSHELVVLRCVVIALNSFAGCGTGASERLTARQTQFLEEIAKDVKDMCSWTEVFENIS